MGMRGGGGLLLRIFDRVRDVPPSSSNHDPISGQTMQKKNNFIDNDVLFSK